MEFLSYISEWIEILLRWSHVMFAILWVGNSFLFNFLDNKLEKNMTSGEVDADGILQHSGWFYRVERLKVAPEKFSKNLIVFKWQSYLTFITGALLLIIIYYANSENLMIDESVNENITPLMGIGISIFSIIGSWLIYDLICKSKLINNKIIFPVVLLIIGAIISFGLTKIFEARFAFLSVGVILGCIMFFNVFFVIVPNGKNITASALNKKEFDVNLSFSAKIRSVHNNIITFLVLFIMLSSWHAYFIWTSQWNWIILLLLAIILGFVRHFFNLKAKEKV